MLWLHPIWHNTLHKYVKVWIAYLMWYFFTLVLFICQKNIMQRTHDLKISRTLLYTIFFYQSSTCTRITCAPASEILGGIDWIEIQLSAFICLKWWVFFFKPTLPQGYVNGTMGLNASINTIWSNSKIIFIYIHL